MPMIDVYADAGMFSDKRQLAQDLTPAGVLYDIDVRLRPDGEKGLLVSSLAA